MPPLRIVFNCAISKDARLTMDKFHTNQIQNSVQTKFKIQCKTKLKVIQMREMNFTSLDILILTILVPYLTLISQTHFCFFIRRFCSTNRARANDYTCYHMAILRQLRHLASYRILHYIISSVTTELHMLSITNYI